ncbi:hypothetical protein JXR93_11990 [bacterium]|nr:hypothetical protein [bacterium]
MKKFLFIISILMPILLSGNSMSDLFYKGNEAYKKGEYKKALSFYELLEQKGVKSDSLFYNMGNSYVQLGKYGYGILYYEKALVENPNFSNAQENLGLAQTKNIDKILLTSGKAEMVGSNAIYSFFRLLDFKMLMVIFTVFWAIFWIILAGRKKEIPFFKKTVTIILLIVSFLIFISVGVLIVGNRYSHSNIDLGVIVESGVTAKDGADEQYRTTFSIHEGIKVHITKEKNGWYQISLPNGNIGWVNSSVCKKI